MSISQLLVQSTDENAPDIWFRATKGSDIRVSAGFIFNSDVTSTIAATVFLVPKGELPSIPFPRVIVILTIPPLETRVISEDEELFLDDGDRLMISATQAGKIVATITYVTR